MFSSKHNDNKGHCLYFIDWNFVSWFKWINVILNDKIYVACKKG